MCGFIGYYDSEKDQNHIKIDSIAHRGPDNTSVTKSSNWKVHFCRLAINDLSSNGNQPFKLAKIITFVNGEIYNSKLLRAKYFKDTNFISNSDCEVIPHLYKKFGINFIEKLDGMFSIVIIDDELNKLYLIKDSFGKKPIYYTEKPFNFCSEARLFKKDSKISKENVCSLLSSHFKFYNQTIFENIKSLPPGSYLEYSEKKISIKTWYKPDIKFSNINNVNLQFYNLFENSVKKRLMSDVQIGVFLSGGMDSNLIINALDALGKKKIKTFTGIIEDIDISQNSTDTKKEIIKKTKHLDLDNHFVDINYNYINKNFVKLVSEMDHPILDTGYIIAYALAEKAKENNCKVIFSGIGGDECFGGYNWQSRYLGNQYIRNFIISFLSNFSKYFVKFNNKYVNYIFHPYFLHLSSLSLSYFRKKKFHFFQASKANTLNSIINIKKTYKNYFKNEFRNYLDFINIFGVMNHQLMTFDLACMKNSVENRSPFLDRKLFEYCLSIPSKYKKKNKNLLLQIFKQFFPNAEFENNEKSGPVINFAIFFNNDEIRSNAKKFIINNLNLLEKTISLDFTNYLKNNLEELEQENFRPMIAIITLLIWLKHNLNKNLDKNISLTNLFETN